MHEVSVVSDIVSAILKELEKYNVEKVEEEIVTTGTELEGSKLVIEHEKIRVLCSECGYEGEVRMLESDYGEHTIPILSCPKCNGKVKVTAGQTCKVRNLKIVEAE